MSSPQKTAARAVFYFYVVRIRSIDLRSRPWQGRILPLNYIRVKSLQSARDGLYILTINAIHQFPRPHLPKLASVFRRREGYILELPFLRMQNLLRKRVHVEGTGHGEPVRSRVKDGEHVTDRRERHAPIYGKEVP